MVTKKPTLKKLKSFIDDSTVILTQNELNWLKEKLGEYDSGYQAYARVNQTRIDNHNIRMTIECLKARDLL